MDPDRRDSPADTDTVPTQREEDEQALIPDSQYRKTTGENTTKESVQNHEKERLDPASMDQTANQETCSSATDAQNTDTSDSSLNEGNRPDKEQESTTALPEESDSEKGDPEPLAEHAGGSSPLEKHECDPDEEPNQTADSKKSDSNGERADSPVVANVELARSEDKQSCEDSSAEHKKSFSELSMGDSSSPDPESCQGLSHGRPKSSDESEKTDASATGPDQASPSIDSEQPSTSAGPVSRTSRGRQVPGVRSEDLKDMSPEEKTARLHAAAEAFASFHEISDQIYEFPDSLEKFGYRFNQDGQLRTIDGDQPFEYGVKDSHNYNQQRYEALGELVDEYIYGLLTDECGLERHPVPNPPPKSTPLHTFIFASKGAFQKEKLLVLVHGTGMVRAGQWTRKLIINESVDTGSQLPYIQWGLDNGYGVVVLNTNHNKVYGRRRNEDTGKLNVADIPFSRTAEEHAQYAWTRYIKPSRAKYIAYVAHSYGGLCVAQNARDKSFRYRVFAVALTESLHNMDLDACGQAVRKYFNEVALNWITSDQPLDARMPPTKRLDAPRFSAGTLKHEWTPHTARQSVFKYINDRFEENEVHPFRDDSLCTLL